LRPVSHSVLATASPDLQHGPTVSHSVIAATNPNLQSRPINRQFQVTFELKLGLAEPPTGNAGNVKREWSTLNLRSPGTTTHVADEV